MIFFVGFFSGIFYASFWPLTWQASLCLSFAFIGLFVLLRKAAESQGKSFKVSMLIVFCLAFSLGVWRLTSYEKNIEQDSLGAFVGKKISGKATVVDEPDQRENSLRLTTEISLGGEEGRNHSEDVLMTVNTYLPVHFGNTFSFQGTLKRPENFTTDTGRTFNYIRFLEKDGIFYQVSLPVVTDVSHGHGPRLQDFLLKIKYSFLNATAKIIPEPELSLLGGLLLGTKQSLGKKLLGEFQTAGVIHMVVISGYNITIVGEAVAIIFSFLPRLLGFSISSAVIICFVLMTGTSGASVRALIMALIAILAKIVGRQYDVRWAVFVAAFLMVFYNPLSLAFDPSFQLSFLATMALLYVSPIIAPYLLFLPASFKLRETVTATVSTQLFLLPFLLYQSGIFSVVALPVNILVLFPVPFTMLMGFITGLVAFVSPVLAMPFGFVADLVLKYILYVVETAANFSFAAVSFWVVALCYLCYAIILWRLHLRNASRSPPS